MFFSTCISHIYSIRYVFNLTLIFFNCNQRSYRISADVTKLVLFKYSTKCLVCSLERNSKMSNSVLLFLLLLHFSSGFRKLPRIKIDVTSGKFVDAESGFFKTFHGINSVIKHEPWYDAKMLRPLRHKQLASLGINVVRLGAMWTGVQPEGPQRVNRTYIKVLKSIVNGLASRGIYTVLDMHQDVLWQAGSSDKFGYFGVPPWLKVHF